MSGIEIVGLAILLWLVFLVKEDILKYLFDVPEIAGQREDDAPDGPDPINKVAIVRTAFGGVETSLASAGKVELNGVQWNATTRSRDAVFFVDDKVAITNRDGLTLIVARPDDV